MINYGERRTDFWKYIRECILRDKEFYQEFPNVSEKYGQTYYNLNWGGPSVHVAIRHLIKRESAIVMQIYFDENPDLYEKMEKIQDDVQDFVDYKLTFRWAESRAGSIPKGRAIEFRRDNILSEAPKEYWDELIEWIKKYAIRLKNAVIYSQQYYGLIGGEKIQKPTNNSIEKNWKDITESFEKEIEELDLSDSEKEAIVKQRMGQGEFRDRLILRSKTKSCAISRCPVDNSALLIASHIKPWSKAENSGERWDPDNGFLLCPNHDKLFDKGLITFADNGKMMISKKLSSNCRVGMNVDETMEITLSEGNRKYLTWHRKEFDRKEKEVVSK